MAPARVSHILWLACLLPWAPAAVAAGLYKLHLVSNGPATTGAEVTLTANLVASNRSLVLPTSARLYRFHWVYSPLLLSGKTEEALSSTIRAVGRVPGDFPVAVWVTAADCGTCQPVARSRLVLSIKESIVGKLVVAQNGSLHWGDAYVTKTALRVSFLLHDPSSFFKAASFLYTWDLGDGTQMVTEDPMVYCNYSVAGTFTVKLTVVAEWERTAPDAGQGVVQKAGDFSTSLWLQEPLRGVQIAGPTQVQTFELIDLNLSFLGSAPVTICWRIKYKCAPLDRRECLPVTLVNPVYNLTHAFSDPGEYCFSFRAHNAVSRIFEYHRVQVWPSSFQPAVFAFPCATLITMMLAFIMYMTLRSASNQKDMVENPEPPTEAKCCQVCCVPFLLDAPSEYLEVARENQGLLPPLQKPVKTYTV